MAETTAESGNHRVSRTAIVAAVAGVLAALLALATPVLPVRQTTADLNWPQNGRLASVQAPLIGYVATALRVSIPCSAAARLDEQHPVLISTVPRQAPKAAARGLLVQRSEDDLTVVVRNIPVVSAPLQRVTAAGGECSLTVTADPARVVAEFTGLTGEDGAALRGEHEGDLRPQIVGVYTDLSGAAPDGLAFSADIDTRWSSSPSPIKRTAMLGAVLLALIALAALHVLDTSDGMRHRRLLPARWWSVTRVDAAVVGVLGWWHFVGANTSDDGYILTMTRVAPDAGYMANYYRWFGTPEAPFGWYYDLLTRWAQISTASIWVRLPTLLMALACWWLISREVIPRLGRAVDASRVAAWTAAGLFCAFWLPFNNGLRPEPLIALGILATWCSVERAVATSRLLPLAIACVIGAFTLFSGPTGIAAIGALLVTVGPLRAIVARRARGRGPMGLVALLAPVAAAAAVVLVVIFADQTLAGEIAASRLKSAIGPSLAWFEEHVRYDRLFLATPDGAVARRLPVLAMFVALAASFGVSLRGRIPGTAAGPARRLIGITVIALFAMMFTPTKWTHHFGVLAGLAGALGALGAVALSVATARSRRSRALLAALMLFVLALSFASLNGWWYVADFGVPWAGIFPKWHVSFATMFMGLTALALLAAGWFHLTERPGERGRELRRAVVHPLALAVWAIVLFDVASLTAALVTQYPAWTIGRSNLQALPGVPGASGHRSCGLADDVLVEPDPAAGMLTPVDGPAMAALGAGASTGFRPDALPDDITPDPVTPAGVARDLRPDPADYPKLPYGLDPKRVPVLGSWRTGEQIPSLLRSGWYRLPPVGERGGPLLVVSAAGRFKPDRVFIEWTSDHHSDEVDGAVQLTDVGAAPSWRDLRVPLTEIPDDASRVRVVARDDDLAPRNWIAVLPPRIPQVRTLQEVVGSTDPVFLDWLVGLSFPCQRPFGHRDGVDEVPAWRILPSHAGDEANSPVMDANGGGPLGVVELLSRATTVPGYLNHDWSRDWGSLQRLVPYYPDAPPARLNLGGATRNGWWSPAPLWR